jgi:4'-phosphopantetheinyl transferase
MGIILRDNLADGKGELAIWEVSETPEELLLKLRSLGIYADVPFFRNPKRLAEWLAVRLLFAELGIRQRIVYDDMGKPHLEGEGKYVSISHSANFVGVIYHTLNRVGVDIERTGDRIHRVSHKFVSDKENAWLTEPDKTSQLYIIWGAKECAYKIFGSGSIDFRDHLEVMPFRIDSAGTTRIVFTRNDKIEEYRVFYRNLEGLMVTYAIAS